MKPSKKWRRKSEIHKIFAEGNYDFSEQAAQELFDYESKGIGSIEKGIFCETNNGYALGKKWCDLQITSWLEDCNIFDKNLIEKNNYRGWFNVLREIYSDDIFPWWWLDEIFNGFIRDKQEFYQEIGMNSKDLPMRMVEEMKAEILQGLLCPISVKESRKKTITI